VPLVIPRSTEVIRVGYYKFLRRNERRISWR